MKIKINQANPINKLKVRKIFTRIFIIIIGIMFVLPGRLSGNTGNSKKGQAQSTGKQSKNKDIKTLKDPENSILHTPFVTEKPTQETAPISVVTANELKTKLEVVEEKLNHLADTMRFYHYGFIFLIIFALVGLGLLILLIVMVKNDLKKILYARERSFSGQKSREVHSQSFLKDTDRSASSIDVKTY